MRTSRCPWIPGIFKFSEKFSNKMIKTKNFTSPDLELMINKNHFFYSLYFTWKVLTTRYILLILRYLTLEIEILQSLDTALICISVVYIQNGSVDARGHLCSTGTCIITLVQLFSGLSKRFTRAPIT